MTDVLVVASRNSRELAVVAAMDRLQAAGARVWYAAYSRPRNDLGLPPGAVHVMRGAAGDGRDPGFWRRVFAETLLARQVWEWAGADEWVRAKAADADVLVALDQAAVYSVWQLAQENPGAVAVWGLSPAHDAVRSIRDSGASRPRQPRRPRAEAVRAAVPSEPPAPGGMLRRAARRLKAGLREAGAEKRLAALLETADAAGRAVGAELVEGRPLPDLVSAYSAELDLADAYLGEERLDESTASYLQATRLAFHRAAHFDSVSSPLAQDPEGFIGPLVASRTHRRLNRRLGRESAAVPAAGRPTRVLIACQGNDAFLGCILRSIAADPGIEVEVVMPADLGSTGARATEVPRLLRSVLARGDREIKTAERDLRERLDWADVVFLEWCDSLAYVFTLVDPGTTKMIVRLHGYEAFTVWPHLVDFTRVDAVVFPSEHHRALVSRATPNLRESGAAQLVIPNAVELAGFRRPKDAAARFVLGLVGFSSIAKDPCWAFEVLRELRRRDDRYQLLLIGGDLEVDESTVARRYVERFAAELAELEAEGAVQRYGPTDDVPRALERVGVIVSSSVRESQHLGLIEGAASGAVPVVRDWPFYATGAEGLDGLFPREWVIGSVADAVERVLSATGDERRWRELGEQAAGFAMDAFDFSTVGPAYRGLFTT